MFLPIVTLKRKVFFSNATRNATKFINFFSLQTKHKLLILKKKWLSGRNDSGRIVIWTKGSLKKKFLSPIINFNLRYNKLALISSFLFIPFKNKILSVLNYNNGAVSYVNGTTNFFLFEYFYWNRKKLINKFYSKLFWSLLFLIKKLSLISFIEILPHKYAQYVLSSGSKAKLFAIDKITMTCVIILPSRVKKLFSCFSTALLGQNLLEEKKKFINGKSGYWRSFGFKSVVRGVAMNPVDHPHGGRTKAVRYQRTPWGKTTKKK